jgi:hypothetical protein
MEETTTSADYNQNASNTKTYRAQLAMPRFDWGKKECGRSSRKII